MNYKMPESINMRSQVGGPASELDVLFSKPKQKIVTKARVHQAGVAFKDNAVLLRKVDHSQKKKKNRNLQSTGCLKMDDLNSGRSFHMQVIKLIYVNINPEVLSLKVLRSMILASSHDLTIGLSYIKFLPEHRLQFSVSLPPDDDHNFLMCCILPENLPQFDFGHFPRHLLQKKEEPICGNCLNSESRLYRI
jgi:hypothetical protein